MLQIQKLLTEVIWDWTVRIQKWCAFVHMSPSCKKMAYCWLDACKYRLKFRSFIATKPPIVDVCSPHVCGPYSICHEVHQHPVCSCQSGYIGMPPNCRPECVVSSECPQDKACINQKCVNPCTPGTCADNAICKVVNHNPICSCSPGFSGDPFVRCNRRERKLTFSCTCIFPMRNHSVFCEYCSAIL